SDFESWQQHIRLYCKGKDNGENILKSIDEEQDRVFADPTPDEKDRYKADVRATNILLQGLPKDIYTLINHYTNAKDIWDNVKMLFEGSELTKDEPESQLYDEFEHFRQNKGETIHEYYVKTVKDSKRYQPWSLLKEIPNTTYPTSPDMIKMDDPNITMEEYIRLEEEKSSRRGKVYNWETTKYGKIWYDKDFHDLRSVETEFLAIVFNDELTSEKALSCEPTVSSLNNNKIDFRISFDESDDEDYTVIFERNSFSYKIISVNNLKMDSENDNKKVNMPSFPSSKPTDSYFNDLDFFKDFENEFPAIIYNDAPMSKLDFLTEPTVSPQHIDEFNLRDETSLSECDEEGQNILYFNDLLPFNVIYPDDSKSDKDNDDDKIDIEHSSGGNVINTDDGAYAQSIVYTTYSLNEYNDLAGKKLTTLVKYRESGI
ncbi:hypothetical protein Tco_1009072, partial [Tanacetum coccineum]